VSSVGSTAAAHAGEVKQPVYVWDLIVRSAHWLIFFSILILSATGVYISRPFASAPGSASQNFITGWVRVVHFYTAIVFSVAVMARVIWMFTGTRYASWKEWVPVSRERRRGLIGSLKFYLFLRREPPPATGHNPLAGLMYVVVFGIYAAMIATGLGLYAIDAHYGSPAGVFGFVINLVGGPQNARWIHHVGMWLLLGFMVQHVYSAILMSRVEKNGCVDSMVSGYKLMPRGTPSTYQKKEHRHA
jgi:Ni/Fe-hydrogenase 1 B-type cytochrome subunit